MLSLELLLVSLVALSTPTLAGSHRDHNVHARSPYPLINPRDYITPETRRESYDYIIAGGGLAGLVLANRLSADGETTVLVLEAGDTGDADRARIDTPATTYFDSLLGSSYNWGFKTVAQANAGGREISWPRGKLLGGSTAVNGMYLVRPSAKEVDSIRDLIAESSDKSLADLWSWDSLHAAMNKGETFTPPTSQAAETAGMRYDAKSHGSSGPLHATFPGYMIPLTSTWLPTLQAAGIPISDDAYGGNNLGAFFSTMAINPSNWTRSYSKSAYIDTLPPRSNLHILANAAVTRILFSDDLKDGKRVATGVEFARDATDAKKTVNAKKEVILAGGSIGSPHMLLVSGVGPKPVLDNLGIPVEVELPGVGHHMQDHLSLGVFWETSEETQGTIYNSGSDLSRTPEFLSSVNSGTCYVNGTFLFDGQENFNNYLAEVKKTFNDASALQALIPSTDPTVIEGYKAIYQTMADKVLPDGGLVEILLSINVAGRVTIQAALQTPLSQGRLYINSTSIFDPPVLDPQYFSHPADIAVLRQGLKHVRFLSTISPLKEILGAETQPGPQVQTDEDWENYIRQTASTEFHPGCTCVMLPREKGGVVDATLKVYGIDNVRVADGSVFPMSMSAHGMAPTYGLAEKAAEIILSPPSTSSNGGSNGGSSSNSGSGSNGGSNNTNAASAINGFNALLLSVAGVVAGIFFNSL